MKRFFIALILTVLIGSLVLFFINYKTKDAESSEIEYIFDVSFAEIIDVANLKEITNQDEAIIMIGNKNDDSTAKMSTFLKEIVNDYNLKVYYLEKENIDNALYEDWVNSIADLNNYSSFTPILLVFKNNILISGYPGDAEYRNLYSFLKYCEVIGVEEDE